MADRETRQRDRRAPRRNVAATLDQWAGGDWRRRNAAAVMLAAGVMIWLTAAAWPLQDRVSFLRGVALAFVGAHVLRHGLVLCTLARLRREGMTEAARALDAYRDPRRLTSLDLAALWLGYMVLVPIVDRLAAGAGPLAG